MCVGGLYFAWADQNGKYTDTDLVVNSGFAFANNQAKVSVCQLHPYQRYLIAENFRRFRGWPNIRKLYVLIVLSRDCGQHPQKIICKFHV